MAAVLSARAVTAQPAWRRHVPRELNRIILRCLRKDPARRFQIMADLAVELDEVKTDSGSQIGVARVPASRPRWLWPAVAAIVLVAVGMGVWSVSPQSSLSLSSGRVGPLTSLPGDERFATLSPDGNQVAFSWSGEKGENTDIYVMPVGAGTPLRLTTDPALDTVPSWSPDGKHIAFVRRQGNEAAVYLTTPPVPEAEKKLADIRLDLEIAFGPSAPTAISWLSDGSRLVVVDRDVEGQMNGIVVLPIGPGEPRRLVWTPVSEGVYRSPALSASADLLGFAFCRFRYSCNVHAVELTVTSSSRIRRDR